MTDSRTTQIVKRKSPSRVRYEQSHPTVSCRVSKEIYDKLQKAKEAEDKSFADILKIGLGMLEVEVKNAAEIRRKAKAEGYQNSYAEAERLFKVTYNCNVCQRAITVTSPNTKEAIKKFMQDNGWGHTECHNRSR